MEYQFYHGSRGPVADLSMEQAALGRWLTEELNNVAAIHSLLKAIEQIRNGQRESFNQQGHSWHLTLDRDEAEVKANALVDQFDDDSQQQMQEEGLDFYDSEEMAGCGFDDFEDLILAWRDFVN